MSETVHSNPAASEPTEPKAARRAVPVWLLVLLFLLIYWGFIYFDQRSGWCSPVVYGPYHSAEEVDLYQYKVEGPDPANGRAAFEKYCSLCHNTDGAGKPGQAPPLAGSEWVNAAGVNRLIRIPVLGLTGQIEVNGKPYDFPAGMTPIAASREAIPDKDLSDILTYVRQAWGNKGAPVTLEQVKAIRDEVANRSTQLTVKELKELPETK
jgi:mono/diheme cytochrome c family protein